MSDIISNPCQTSSGEGVCVSIRMRPMNDRELKEGQEKAFKCNQNTVFQCQQENQLYGYDKVFDENVDTMTVYSHIGKEIVKGVTEGINGTIFAYGQTSSGKTHTMLGTGREVGILSLAAADVFNHISNCPTRDFLLRVSFVEIYNENIRDLLSDSPTDSKESFVAIREDPRKGVYCEASEVIITDYQSIIRTLNKGIAKRAVECTAMNDTSSRSHTIFKLVVESKANNASQDIDGAVLVASLNLVDLAGSESVRHTGATGQRAKEGGKINQSLLSLSRVIHALSTPNAHVSFRDSKLTRLLQPSLSGNAKMSVVCCITPAEKYLEETRSTLQFASRAKLVKTDAKVNEVVDDSVLVKRLKRELDELKQKQLEIGSNSANNSEEYNRLEAEKESLLASIVSLQKEKDHVRVQLDTLKELFITGGDNDMESKKRTRTKKFRDTWCPGAGGIPPSLMLATIQNDNDHDDSFSSNSTTSTKKDANSSANDSFIDKENLSFHSNSSVYDELASARVTIDKLNEVILTLTTSNEEKQHQLHHANKTIEDLREELDEMNTTEKIDIDDIVSSNTLMKEMSAKDDEITRLSALLTKSNNDLIVLSEEKCQLEIQMNQIDEMREGTNTEYLKSLEMMSSLEHQLRTITATNSSYVAENTSLKQQYEAIVAKCDNLDGELVSSLKKIEELSTEVANAEELLTEMEKDSESMRIQFEESISREEALANAVQEADNEINGNREQINVLEKQLEIFITNSASASDELTVLLSQLSEVKACHATSLEEVATLLSKVKEYEVQLESFKSENSILNEKIVSVQSKFDEHIASLETEITNKDVILVEKDEMISKLTTEINSVANEVLANEVQSRAAHNDIATTLLVNNLRGESELSQLSIENAKKDMEHIVEKLRSELGTKESELSKLMALNTELVARVTVAEQINAANADKEVQENIIDDNKTKKLGQLQANNDLLKCEKDVLLRKLSECENELKLNQSQFRNVEDKLNNEIMTLSQRLEKNNHQNIEQNRMNDTIKSLDDKIKSLKSERDEYVGLYNNGIQRIDELEEENRLLLSKIDTLNDSNSVETIKNQNILFNERNIELENSVLELTNRLKKSKDDNSLMQIEWDKTFDESKIISAQRDDLKLKLQTAMFEILQLKTQQDDEKANDQEEEINRLQNELIQLAESKSSLELQVAALSKEVETSQSKLLEVKHNDSEEIRSLKNDLDAANEHCALTERMLNEYRSTMNQEMELKDKRITHLEACKLTKEQLEKIKDLKEEKKKVGEDNKVMKKQLHALKKAYDELKSTTTSTSSDVGNNTSLAREIADLKVQIATVTSKLETSQNSNAALTSKLKQSATQILEWEKDRSTIMNELDRVGIDTTSLLLADTSMSMHDGDKSIIEQSLGDVVAKLAEQYMTLQKSTLSYNEATSSQDSKLRELNQKINVLNDELKDTKSQKLLLEKRVETIKSTSKEGRDELLTMTAEAETWRAKVEELQEILNNTEAKNTQSTDAIASEMQCLEEENLELMKENKELRKMISAYRVQSDKNSSNDKENISNNRNNDSQVKSQEIQLGKRSNTNTEVPSASKTDVEKSIIETTDSAVTNSAQKIRRTRTKAKPVVASSANSSETVGECNQS